jgi:hypothetical protein
MAATRVLMPGSLALGSGPGNADHGRLCTARVLVHGEGGGGSRLITLIAYIVVIALVVDGAVYLVGKARRSIGGGRRRIGR